MNLAPRLRWLPLLGAALLAGACGRASGEAGTAADADSRPGVHRGDLAVRTLLTGELVAEDAVLLVAPNVEVWPLQIRWLAEDGAEVRAGEPVVEFDNSQLATNLEEMRVRVIEAATRLESLMAQRAADEVQAVFELEQSRGELEKARIEAAVPPELLDQMTYERRQLDLRRAEFEFEEAKRKLASKRQTGRSEIEIQRIALDKTRTEVARAEEGIELLTLRAPRDGILVRDQNFREDRTFQEGDRIFPGQTVARLPDLGTLVVEARLFDVDDGRVTPGMALQATLDAFPDQAFSGRVREIDRVAKVSGRRSLRRSFRTIIDLERIDPERMRPGMSVKAVIQTTHEDVPIAPRRSLEWTGEEARLLPGGTPVALGVCNAQACVVEEVPAAPAPELAEPPPEAAASVPEPAAAKPAALAPELAAAGHEPEPATTAAAGDRGAPDLAAAAEAGRAVRAWAAAWSEQRVDDFLGCYAPDFSPPGMSRREWVGQRRHRIRGPSRIEVLVRDLEVEVLGPARARARFHQQYESDTARLATRKILELVRRPAGWKIVREQREE